MQITWKKRSARRAWKYRCRSKTCHPGCLCSAWKTGNRKMLFVPFFLFFSQPGIWISSKEKSKKAETEINSHCHKILFVSLLLEAGLEVSERIMIKVGKDLKAAANSLLVCSLCSLPLWAVLSPDLQHRPQSGARAVCGVTPWARAGLSLCMACASAREIWNYSCHGGSHPALKWWCGWGQFLFFAVLHSSQISLRFGCHCPDPATLADPWWF